MSKKIKHYYLKAYKFLELFFWKFVTLIYLSNNSELLNDIISINRENLSKIKNFISVDEYTKNDFGIPQHIFKNIDKKIDNNPTYTDLIIYLMKNMKKDKLNYLEIGVSVMKNFRQVNYQLTNSKLVAYDINKIVSTFSDKFISDENIENLFHKKEYTNNIYYFKGDVLNKSDAKSFSKALDLKYDFVMSDAMHTKEGVLEEFTNLIEGNLSEEFILYYDDLDFPNLEDAALMNYFKLVSSYAGLNFYTFWISGWVGQNEKMHKNGIITNINLEQILNENNIKLPFFKKIK